MHRKTLNVPETMELEMGYIKAMGEIERVVQRPRGHRERMAVDFG